MPHRIALLLSLIISPCAQSATKPAAPLSHTYDQMLSEFANRSMSTSERYQRLLTHYANARMTIAKPAEASIQDLHSAFSMGEAMLTAAHGYSAPNARRYVADMAALFDELARRGGTTLEQRNSMLGSYLSAWDFDAAKALATTETHIKPSRIGTFTQVGTIEASAPALVSFSEDGSARLAAYQFPKGPLLVVSAGCHIARRAADAVAADPSLSAALKSIDVLWLSPASSALDPAAISEWNRRFPDAEMRVAYDNAKWPGVDFARLPSFHVFVDGKLVTTLNGWGDDKGAINQLWKALATAGIERKPSN
ncbi:hypothetical protein [Xanthomonas sp. WHRI 7945]|nr:hypothetical protein [Xanthomonas campestris pv. campestris]